MAPENKATATGQNAPDNGNDGIGNVARAGLHVLRRSVPGRMLADKKMNRPRDRVAGSRA